MGSRAHLQGVDAVRVNPHRDRKALCPYGVGEARQYSVACGCHLMR